ncbi:MAG: VTT domain-containing protein [Slackia faecicanis]|nr:VTT domain-containing protein [Slackia faecicanis]
MVNDTGATGKIRSGIERLEEYRDEFSERREERRDEFEERFEVPVSTKPAFSRLTKADLFKLAGLAAFFVLMAIACVAIAPMIAELTEPGGLERVIEDVQNAGVGGVFMLLGFQFLQIVVAFIPGEVVQLAAGMMYGPWGGALIVLVGCIVSSAFIFVVVHKLGAPFVHAMIPEKWMAKLEKFEQSEKLDVMVFVLFLIPGLPKDVFTYLVPLTHMRMRDFLFLANVGRIPGILISTFGAAGLIQGDYTQSIILFAIAAVIAIVALVMHEKILHGLSGMKRAAKKEGGAE